MTKEELSRRTKKFAVDVARLCESLPNKPMYWAYTNQLIRCSSSVGANYRAALRAKSSKDFVYKLQIVVEEADESMFFMELIKELGIKEDAPANATGTAVAGTGDDSSTVIMRKRKNMRDRLLRRFKIKETIDRLIPTLEYPKDEITERKKQLKAMAIGSKEVPNFGSSDSRYNSTVASQRVAQDPDVKDKKGTQPKKYYKTLSKSEKEKRAKHFAKQDYKKSDDNDDYKPAPGDKGAKTKLSKYTKKYRQMYGEEFVMEEIKGITNKAKKSGMPYSILKKVYDRGMAAWKGGHRPGTTQQQWAFARVNSFITKSPGTWGKADSDLAKKVRGQ